MFAASVGWISGKYDLADFFFLLAAVVFIIVTVINLMAKALPAALLSVGLAAVAVGWLVL